jgi:hypothetical protein
MLAQTDLRTARLERATRESVTKGENNKKTELARFILFVFLTRQVDSFERNQDTARLCTKT